MTTLENSSEEKSTHLPKWLIWSLIIVSFIGFLDASYLTIAHYTGLALRCSVFSGCEQVTTSPYSVVLGIPVALMGVLYYLTILLATLFYYDSRKSYLPKYIAWATNAGLAASVWFVFLQLFVIKAICQYCMISATTSTLLFIFGIIIIKQYGEKKPQQ
ncbi:MAG: vitamin K epoxide reductase family protein [Candidatus Peregrinibacteria bacterium]|nr:vitamin K epoxide reductase family protein [Candidatus Peregrinibacteria bacterium]